MQCSCWGVLVVLFFLVVREVCTSCSPWKSVVIAGLLVPLGHRCSLSFVLPCFKWPEHLWECWLWMRKLCVFSCKCLRGAQVWLCLCLCMLLLFFSPPSSWERWDSVALSFFTHTRMLSFCTLSNSRRLLFVCLLSSAILSWARHTAIHFCCRASAVTMRFLPGLMWWWLPFSLSDPSLPVLFVCAHLFCPFILSVGAWRKWVRFWLQSEYRAFCFLFKRDCVLCKEWLTTIEDFSCQMLLRNSTISDCFVFAVCG